VPTQTIPIGSDPEQVQTPADIVRLCRAIHQRAHYLGLRNKRADDMAVDFWSGAAVMAKIMGNTALCQRLTMMLALSIAVRGMMGIREIIEGNKHRDISD
jgi:hypothetical protein